MDFYDVIRTRRSVRSFQDKPVPHDVLARVLEAARIAPSGNNRQPWRFVVVKDEKRRKQIAQACYDQSFIAQAPVVIVCCGRQYPNGYEPWRDECYLADTVIAIDHLILAARNEGLGSCWIGAVHDDQVAKIIGAPDDVDVLMVVPIGYPAGETAFNEKCSRAPLEQICFNERYGQR